jgi:prepilin-type N-terminal cleavage/methylation domain-containing protein
MITRIRGFTLIELLVVLAVMGVLMGMLGFSVLGGGSDVSSGQRQILTMLHQARVAALGAGLESRLLVFADPSDSDKYMRFLSVVVRDNNSSNKDSWRVLDEGKYLPDGLWFADENMDTEDGWMEDAYCKWSESMNSQLFSLGPLVRGVRTEKGSKLEYFRFVGFDATGVAYSSDYPQMPRLVIASGTIKPVDGELAPYLTNPYDVAGIDVRPFGGLYLLSSNDFISTQ